MTAASATPELVLVGRIGPAHGIRGEVKLKSFTTDPLAIASYGPLVAKGPRGTRALTVERARSGGDAVIARFAGIADRTAAEALKGLELFVPREALPEPEDEGEFYEADLIGFTVLAEDGRAIGTVTGFANYGASDLLAFEGMADGKAFSALLPFTDDYVPAIDEDARTVTIRTSDASAMDAFVPALGIKAAPKGPGEAA